MRLSFRAIAGVIIMTLTILMLVASGFAETTWIGTDEDDLYWGSTTNWAPNSVPNGDTAVSINGGTVDPVLSSSALAGSLLLNKALTFDPDAALTVANDIVVGMNGTGQVNQVFGVPGDGWILPSSITADALVVGDSAGGNQGTHKNSFNSVVLGARGSNLGYGTYNLSSGFLEINGEYSSLVVGGAGTGVFNHHYGFVTLNNGSRLIIGGQYQGTYNHTAGHVFTSDALLLGDAPGSEGTYNMLTGPPEGTGLHVGVFENPRQMFNTPLIVGGGGKGFFNQNGGWVEVSDMLVLGESTTGVGRYTMGDSYDASGKYCVANLTVFNGTYLGMSGKGYLTQDAGAITSCHGMVLGQEAGSYGEFNQNGGTAEVWDTMTVGQAGEGHVIQSGGSLNITDKLVLGAQYGSTGTIVQDLMGTGAITAKELVVGQNGYGEYQMYGGSLVVVDKLAIGVGTETFSRGIMDIHSFNASVTIKESMTIGEHGEFRTGPGVIINLTGSNFYNNSTDPSAVDMTGVTMKFSNDPETPDTFEAAGTNGHGFSNNFALGTLELGPGNVMLVDGVDNNGNGIYGDEVLYVALLILGVDATLDLNHFYLFCQEFQNNGGALLNAEHLVQLSTVPLPGAVWLLGSGLLGLVGLRRFKKN
jgi:hypothetical protein